MKIKNLNGSYKYCDAQIAWLKKVFSKDKKLLDIDEREVEEAFYKEFGIRRTYNALRVKAWAEGARRRREPLQVGVSIKRAKDGDPPQICISTDPVRYMSLARYNWQKHYGTELGKDEVVVHLDGDPLNCDIDNLDVVSRRDLLLMNSLPKAIDVRTRVALARLEGRVDDLKGRGVWSEEEVDWVLSLKIPSRAPDKFWVRKAEEFNRKFGKNRTSRCLIVAYHRK